MPEAKDTQLIGELVRATQEGRIRWTATAKPDELTASVRGKFSIVLAKVLNPLSMAVLGMPLPQNYQLKVLDDSGTLMHRVEDPSVGPLFEMARRAAFHVDQAIDEILAELKAR